MHRCVASIDADPPSAMVSRTSDASGKQTGAQQEHQQVSNMKNQPTEPEKARKTKRKGI
jgi:hypothetical protein